MDHSQIIHEGGHVGSRNQKRRWVLHWRGVILTDLGHGRSRDRLRSILSLNCGTTFHRFLINHCFLLLFFCFLCFLLLLSPEETMYGKAINFVAVMLQNQNRKRYQYWYTVRFTCFCRRCSWMFHHCVVCNEDIQSNLTFDFVPRRHLAH